jgi:alpha-mannosidase
MFGILGSLGLSLVALAQSPSPPIRPWLITAPVQTDTGTMRLAVDYLRGATGAAERDAFPDAGGAWSALETPEDGVVDLNQVVPPGTATAFTVVYAFTYIRSPGDETRRLVIASDDDVVAWLNGQQIHRREIARGTDGRDTLTVRLAAGWNTLLLKILNRQGGFGFGAWFSGGAALPASNRRPPDGRPGNLPAPSVTLEPPRLEGPLVWSGDSLTANVTTVFAGWGAAPPDRVTLRFAIGRDTIPTTPLPALAPDMTDGGSQRTRTHRLDLAALARLALADTIGAVVATWPGGRVVSRSPVSPRDLLALTDGRLAPAWRPGVPDANSMSAMLVVPSVLTGLSVDLLPGELGPNATYTVNGEPRSWRAGAVPVCDSCRLGEAVQIVIRRDSTRAWSNTPPSPSVRVRNRTYSDVALNVRLLPALGDSSGAIAPPDARDWLTVLLRADKTAYLGLAARYDSLLAVPAARVRRDTIILIGHSHIDAAWLWRYAETWGVVENTWRTALRLQDRFPGATFAASSAQYYRWLDTRVPALIDSIRTAVQRGTWSLVGGWWVEGDQNIPSGESLVRQGLYGQRYFQRTFGRRARIAWTPDSFGYPWTMPQIWLRLGMTAFVTQKIRWNDSTEFPHDAFFWEGRDGSRIFSYNPWGYDHNLAGSSLAREMRIDNARTDSARHMAVLYGVGDHGGGPTIAMLERRDDLRRLPAFPVLRDAAAEPALAAVRAARPETAWPVWRDELYLEYHRGTYTTQAEMKRRNRRGEELLATTEMLSALDTAAYPRRTIERAWQQLLFNQFHDLLPGSGIREIYTDAALTYDSVWAAALPLRDAAFAHLAAGLDTRGDGVPIVVFNPASWVRTSYAAVPVDTSAPEWRGDLRAVDAARRSTIARLSRDSVWFLAREVPPLGFKVFWIVKERSTRPPPGSLAGSRTHLENDLLAVEVDTTTGQITRLYDKAARREVLRPGGRGNVLQLFGDRPANWDAWDIGYTGESWQPDSVRALRAGGDDLARWIEVEKRWNGTRIVQRFVLRREEALLTIENTVDWHETRKLLKVAFDWNVTADSATYEIAYGAIGQPTAPRTQGERAKYEHAGHRWADLSEATWGVSLLNDSKYGWDTRGSRMRLSLLRAPLWPDSLADRGRHQFRYAVYPHAGDWRAALTVRRGQEFNQPLLAARERAHPGTSRGWAFVAPGADNVHVTAVKRAEDTNAYVLRLVEWHGQETRTTLTFGRRIARVRTANLLEDPSAALPVAGDGYSVTVTLKPWEILTLLVEESR